MPNEIVNITNEMASKMHKTIDNANEILRDVQSALYSGLYPVGYLNYIIDGLDSIQKIIDSAESIIQKSDQNKDTEYDCYEYNEIKKFTTNIEDIRTDITYNSSRIFTSDIFSDYFTNHIYQVVGNAYIKPASAIKIVRETATKNLCASLFIYAEDKSRYSLHLTGNANQYCKYPKTTINISKPGDIVLEYNKEYCDYYNENDECIFMRFSFDELNTLYKNPNNVINVKAAYLVIFVSQNSKYFPGTIIATKSIDDNLNSIFADNTKNLDIAYKIML